MSLEYRDTVEFIPVDADKGIDRLTGEFVQADDVAPDGYNQLAKCKFCKNYTATEENMGVCEASKQEPKFFAYGDMTAVSCMGFCAK